jgi:phosphate transport system protein
LEERDSAMDEYNTRLMQEILKLDCPDAVPVAIKTVLVGRSLERIADHSVVIGERLRYLLTGNPATLVNEVRPVRDDE